MSYRRAGDDTGDMSKDTLFQSDKPPKPKERKGIFQSCEWFKEDPCTRWPFVVMLLFGCLTPIWLLFKATGSKLTGIKLHIYYH